METEDLKVSPNNQVSTATNDLIRLTWKVEATSRVKEGEETKVTIYTSLDVIGDLLFHQVVQ